MDFSTRRLASSGSHDSNRFVEPQLAFLDQDHCRNRGDGLGDRSDAKDRVAFHRRRIAEVERA
jgi:hypothetical protein